MSSFTDPLNVQQIANSDSWMLLRDLRYYIDTPEGEAVHVKAEFVTDFASIPQPFWSVIGHPAGRYAAAAVVHDHLYRIHTIQTADGESRICKRAEADRIFSQAMAVLGVARWRRKAMWAAVRVGGRAAYRRNRVVA